MSASGMNIVRLDAAEWEVVRQAMVKVTVDSASDPFTIRLAKRVLKSLADAQDAREVFGA